MTDFNNILSKVSSKDGLSDEESYFSFNYILDGKASEKQIEKFLLGLRERGEKIEEITAATKVMREKSSKVSAPDNAIDWHNERGISPVPGGKSTKRKSKSPQTTWSKNWRRAWAKRGPLHMTGAFLPATNPIDISERPQALMGTNWSFSEVIDCSCTPVIKGTLGPNMSASNTPTL